MKKRVLIVIAGGGFEYESIMLIKNLESAFDFAFLTSGCSDNLKTKIGKKGKIFCIDTMFNMKVDTLSLKLFRLARAMIQTHTVMRKVKPHAVIWIGDALGVPSAICAKLYGKRVVFIESVTRAKKPSLTGKLVELFHLSDRLYVQWPELVPFYKRPIYKGWVL